MANKPERIQKVIPLSPIVFEHYLPTAFDNSLTILEKLNRVIFELNKLGLITNELATKWNEIVDWLLDGGLYEEINKIMDGWLEDGTLEELLGKSLDGLDEIPHLLEDVEMLKAKVEAIQNLIDRLQNQLNDELKTLPESNALYQKLVNRPFFGIANTQIFDGSAAPPQGLAYVEHDGVEYVFYLHKAPEGTTTWDESETQRITCFKYDEVGDEYVEHIAFTDELKLNHQGLGAISENGKIYLYAGYAKGDYEDAGVGYTKIEWDFGNTNVCNVAHYQIIGDYESGHNLQKFNHNTPTISSNGKYIVSLMSVDPRYLKHDDATNWIAIWDRKEVESVGNTDKVKPLNMFRFDPAPFIGSNIVQDIASDEKYIYVGAGEADHYHANTVVVYTMQGFRLGHFKVDLARGLYDEITNVPQFGDLDHVELEGITIRNGELLIVSSDVWKKNGTNTKRDKTLFRITKNNEGADCGCMPINGGYIPKESYARVHVYGAKNDISYPKNEALAISEWDEYNEELTRVVVITSQNEMRFYDANDKSDESNYGVIRSTRTDDRQRFEIRGYKDESNGSGINLYGKGDPAMMDADSSQIRFSVNTESFGIRTCALQERGAWRAGEDDVQALGTPTTRWRQLYAGTSTISTSDERLKDEIADVDEAVMRAWGKVNYKQFKFKNAIEEKGSEEARIHIGVIAQRIMEAFESEGLDAHRYGLFTYDEWEEYEGSYDDDGNVINRPIEKGDIYGIRGEECLFLECAYLRWKLDAMLNDTENGE